MSFAATLVLLLAVAGTLVLLIQLVAVRVHLRRPLLAPSHCPPISILKPLCGIDDDLEANLECFVALDYPHYELLLGVKDAADPAYPVARRAEERWPDRVRVVMQQGEPGFNPKVNQLIGLEKAARYDILVVSDSNTKVAKAYLQEIATRFEDPEVACVTHPVVGTGQRRLGSLMDNLHLSSSTGPGMIVAQLLAGRDIVVGKSMALRRQDLAALGGFFALKDYLGEDYALGMRIRNELNKKVVVARGVVINISQNRTVGDFLRRYQRWSIVHRSSVELSTYLLQSILHPFALALVAVALYPSATTLLGAAAIGVAKAAIDVLVARSLQSGFGLIALFCVPLKDLILFGAWVNGLFQTTVSWRGNVLRVTAGSVLCPLEDLEEQVDHSRAA